MSELQIGLLAIGAVIITGVYGFNLFQERKYRRQADQAFAAEHDDVLLQAAAAAPSVEVPTAEPIARDDGWGREEPRIEPVAAAVEAPIEPEMEIGEEESVGEIEPVIAASVPSAEAMPVAAETVVKADAGAMADEAIDFIARIHPDAPVSRTAILDALGNEPDLSKPVHWLGLNQATAAWEEIATASHADYEQFMASLQLADRNGPISADEMAAFCRMMLAVADELAAIADCHEQESALAQAAMLDQFCVKVDVLIGINVVIPGGDSFPATKVRALAESGGLKLQPDGAFHLLDDAGVSLFSLCNLDPTPFSADNIRQLSTHGVTLLFDVPKVPNGLRVFDLLVALARHLAEALDGHLVDDNRRPLSDAGIDLIKRQLVDIYALMDAHRIEAGSVRAQRLFS